MRRCLRRQLSLATICFALAFTTIGCAAVKGMLKPMVCDCADADTRASNCSTPVEQDDPSTVEMARSGVSTSAVTAESTANGDGPPSSSEPNKRTLDRREPKQDPLELIEPKIEDATVSSGDESAIENLKATYPLPDSVSASAVYLRANFDGNDGREVAVVEPGRRIRIYNETEQLADLKFSANRTNDRPAGTKRTGTTAVKVVRDGTAQIVTHWTETDDDGTLVYKVGIFKLIDSFVGRSFTAKLARKPAEQDSFVAEGTYEFLRGEDHAFIRWIPVSDEGDFDASEATVYKWNPWEGVFRVPKPPPTAPKREKLQSHRSPAAAAALAVN